MAQVQSLQWGVLFNGDKLSLDHIVRFATQAEDAGAESIWAAELWRDALCATDRHSQCGSDRPPRDRGRPFCSSSHVDRVGRNVTRRIHSRRFILGLGTAPKDWNEQWHGLEYRKPLPACVSMLSVFAPCGRAHQRRQSEYTGEFYQVRNYRRLTEPVYPNVPIYLAAVLPNMIQLAGALADGIILNVLNTPQYFTDVVHPNLKKGFSRSGRSRDGFEICAVKCCAVNTNRQQARNLARHAVAFYATLPYFDVILDPPGFTQAKLTIRDAMARNDVAAMLAAVSDEMIDALVLAGTPDDVRQQLAAFEGLF